MKAVLTFNMRPFHLRALYMLAGAYCTFIACATSPVVPEDGARNGASAADASASEGNVFLPQACNSAFCWEYPLPLGSKALGIHALADDTVFAVTEGGALLRKAKGAWGAALSQGTETLRGVWASSAADVWAVGDLGTILHYDGKSLTTLPSGTNENLTAIWGADASHIWAVGTKGTILAFDGRSWTAATKVGDQLHAIWGADANNVWAVGGTLNVSTWSHWDGRVWSSVVGGTSSAGLYAVSGTDASNVWAVGEYGHSYRWKGDAFALIGRVSNDDPHLRAVKVYRDRVVAWSEDSTFNWDGAKWSSGEAKGAVSASSAPQSEVVWTTTASGGVRRSDTNADEIATGTVVSAFAMSSGQAFAALRDRTLLAKTADNWKKIGVTADSPEVLYDKTVLGDTADGLLVVAAQAGSTLNFRTFRDTTSRDLPSLPESQPRSVGGKSASDLWVYAGALWHLSGSQWRRQDPGMSLAAFDATHGETAWFVGEVDGNAAVATFANGAFTSHPLQSAKNVRLRTVYAKGGEAWVAGIFSDIDRAHEEDGTNVWPVSLRLWHYNGVSWEVIGPPPLPPQDSLGGVRDVRLTLSPNDELAIGISGREEVKNNLFVRAGGGWSERACPAAGIGHLAYAGKDLWIASSGVFGLGVDESSSGLLRAIR